MTVLNSVEVDYEIVKFKCRLKTENMYWHQNLCRLCGQISEICHVIGKAVNSIDEDLRRYLDIDVSHICQSLFESSIFFIIVIIEHYCYFYTHFLIHSYCLLSSSIGPQLSSGYHFFYDSLVFSHSVY